MDYVFMENCKISSRSDSLEKYIIIMNYEKKERL